MVSIMHDIPRSAWMMAWTLQGKDRPITLQVAIETWLSRNVLHLRFYSFGQARKFTTKPVRPVCEDT